MRLPGRRRSASYLRYAVVVTSRENNRIRSEAGLDAGERGLKLSAWRKRLAQRPETDLGVDAATLVAEARDLRDRERETR